MTEMTQSENVVILRIATFLLYKNYYEIKNKI